MRKIAYLGLALTPLLCPAPAYADGPCSGTVLNSYVTGYGAAIIRGSWGGGYTQICSITSIWKGVSPDVCALWVAKIDSAISTGHTVTLYYYGSTTCSTIPTYGDSPAPYYVMLNS